MGNIIKTTPSELEQSLIDFSNIDRSTEWVTFKKGELTLTNDRNVEVVIPVVTSKPCKLLRLIYKVIDCICCHRFLSNRESLLMDLERLQLEKYLLSSWEITLEEPDWNRVRDKAYEIYYHVQYRSGSDLQAYSIEINDQERIAKKEAEDLLQIETEKAVSSSDEERGSIESGKNIPSPPSRPSNSNVDFTKYQLGTKFPSISDSFWDRLVNEEATKDFVEKYYSFSNKGLKAKDLSELKNLIGNEKSLKTFSRYLHALIEQEKGGKVPPSEWNSLKLIVSTYFTLIEKDKSLLQSSFAKFADLLVASMEHFYGKDVVALEEMVLDLVFLHIEKFEEDVPFSSFDLIPYILEKKNREDLRSFLDEHFSTRDEKWNHFYSTFLDLSSFNYSSLFTSFQLSPNGREENILKRNSIAFSDLYAAYQENFKNEFYTPEKLTRAIVTYLEDHREVKKMFFTDKEIGSEQILSLLKEKEIIEEIE